MKQSQPVEILNRSATRRRHGNTARAVVFCKRTGAVPDNQSFLFRFRRVGCEPQSFMLGIIVDGAEQLCGHGVGSVRRYARTQRVVFVPAILIDLLAKTSQSFVSLAVCRSESFLI